MKLSTVFVGALATLAAAAPAKVEEEKRSSGLDAFGVGGAASLGAVPFFGQSNAVGSIINQNLLGSFNSFAIANPQVAFLLGNNGFDFNALFSIFDLSLGVGAFQPIFSLGAGNFVDINTLLSIQSALVFQWLLNSFGSQLFFQSNFLGFGGLDLPSLNFGGLGAAGLGLDTQILIQSQLLDNSFNSIGSQFLNSGIGLDAFNSFNFANLQNQGLFFKE